MAIMVQVEGNIEKIEGGRASFAFSEVKKFIEKYPDHQSSYRSYVKKMPSIIQVNGLGQALAFYYSKHGERAYEEIYKTSSLWLNQKFPDLLKDKEKTLVEVVINLKSQKYRLFTMEVMSLLNWMRKFVDGMVKEGEN